MQHKRLWVLAALLIGALLLAACPSAAPAPAEEAAPAEGETAAQPAEEAEEAAEAPAAATGACAAAPDGELAGVDPSGQTVVWWHNHSGSREELLNGIIAEFNSSNECGITVEGQNQGGYDEIRDKMNASIAAGEAAAALIVGYQNDQAFYQLNDALVDLDIFVNDPTWGLTEEEQADSYPVFFEQGIHPAFDNQRLGFPPNRSMEMLYYNQTWLEELGFDGPPTTPEEFQEMACAAAEANGDGTGGYILRDDASGMASWTYAYGGDILAEDGVSYTLNDPAVAESLAFLKGVYDAGCAYFFTEGFPNTEFAARRAVFAQGSSSGIPFYENDIATIAGEEGRDPDVWGVAAIPHTTPDPVQNVYGGDVMIPVSTPEQELAAWIFVKWFTEPENQAKWVEASGYFPTRQSTNEFLAEYIETSTGGAQWGQALELMPFGVYEPQLISYDQVRRAMSEAFNAIMQGGDIQTTLDELNEFANSTQEELMAEIE
jgi:multiple sugar transport system substrate-binding protein/sn-glycerol 3-phosphate transport system substrate-binding protein